jgi:MYXO-CTERM domain-containing protein
MKRASRALILAASTLAVHLLTTSGADAYCRITTCDPNNGDQCRRNENGCIRDGVPLIWKTMPIVYRFHNAGSSKLENAAARAAIRRAFDEWSNVECRAGRTSLRFREGDEITKDKPLGKKEGPEKFGIYFRDDAWPHDNAEESLAMTNHTYGKVSGTIDYADIEINTSTTVFALTDIEDGIDLQAVVTHEVGHYIGLAHSNDSESIMVASYCQSADRCGESVDRARQLSDDDRAAVCATYPPEKKTEDPPEQGCSQSRTSDPSNLAASFATLVLGAALLRRRMLSASRA